TVVKRVLDELDVELRDKGAQNIEIDIEEFRRLYYEEELPLDEMAEALDVSVRTIIRYREDGNLEDRVLKYGNELRDELFGTECVGCGAPKKHIHKKDGEPHPSHILWSRKSLLKLKPDDWVALCVSCHRLTHSLMKSFGCEWDDIEKSLKELRRRYLS
ncbi:MAG: hypothetical protein ACTSUB_01010, partial [Candidatus Thorarchaeota archaeon]